MTQREKFIEILAKERKQPNEFTEYGNALKDLQGIVCNVDGSAIVYSNGKQYCIPKKIETLKTV